MAKDSGHALRPPADKPIWRSLLLPALVIAAIAFVIWWLEYRPDGEARSPLSGEVYGPRPLPAALTPGAEVGPASGKLAPDFLLGTLDEGEVRLSDLRGKAVVLNFWATWCSPCRKEMPQLVGAYERFKGQGLVVLGVNVQEDRDTIGRFASEFGIKFPVPIDRSGEVVDEYRLLGLPTTYFIDRQGVVRGVFRGPFQGNINQTSVQGAIEENELLVRIQEILQQP
ncbi:MAG TPA: TlpA disulfide reductase family protein [Dehalococcoidia bacterium]|nr:TlpA disulfide reductase family protein [Dehalococcoidia bacterium]